MLSTYRCQNWKGIYLNFWNCLMRKNDCFVLEILWKLFLIFHIIKFLVNVLKTFKEINFIKFCPKFLLQAQKWTSLKFSFLLLLTNNILEILIRLYSSLCLLCCFSATVKVPLHMNEFVWKLLGELISFRAEIYKLSKRKIYCALGKFESILVKIIGSNFLLGDLWRT